MFNFIKEKLTRIFNSFSQKIATLFGAASVDDNTLQQLEILLLSADTGVSTTKKIINHLKSLSLSDGNSLHEALKQYLLTLVNHQPAPITSNIYILVGINGTGKTTFAAKLAHKLIQEGKRTLIIAADTFRAAAPEQMHTWAQKVGADIVQGKPGQDPAAVVYQGCETFKQNNYDALIIDTAGRLQTKSNLMQELAKIKRTISKHLPDTPIQTLLTIDAMLGQNSLEQARLFKECTDVTGIILTKMDGTGKGGIIFAIAEDIHIPVIYITYGEQLEDIKSFNATEYVNNLLS